MENIIYTDADLNAFLVANEEQDGNTIAVVIECDATASQELTITAGTASTTEALTPSTKNRIEIPSMLWNFGDDTVITLSKGGTDAGEITIHFPAAIDSDAAINETETDNEFTLQGSESVQEQLVSLQESVEKVSAQTLAYILPSAVDQSGIADGGSNTVETFEFEAGAEDVKVSFFTCIQFLATTTVTAANAYEDLMLTITITVDGVAAATILHTYRDGRQVLTINHLIENLSKGNHTLTVSFAASGGSVSVMQIIAAYLLTANSTGGGSITVKDLFKNGEWSPDVLADGLGAEWMSETAYLNGTESTKIKALLAEHGSSVLPDIQGLSAYFLSEYILLHGFYGAKPFYMKNGYYCKIRQSGSLNDGFFYIPIKRLSGFTTLQYEAKIIDSAGSYNVLFMGASCVKNGGMFAQYDAAHENINNWTTYTVNISSLPYVDYIILFGINGAPAYRNIKLLKE